MVSVNIFNIWHHRIFPELLAAIPNDDKQNVVLYGVNETIDKECPQDVMETFRVMLEYMLPHYEGKWQDKGYCQTTCMYHLYHNPSTYKHLDYIGFIQYDMRLEPTFFREIETEINNGNDTIFYMELKSINDAHKWDRAIISHALPHYNMFFNTNFTKADVRTGLPINHTFVIPVHIFDRMMKWITAYLLCLEEQNQPFTKSQAEYSELFIGLFLALECNLNPNLKLKHLTSWIHIWPHYHDNTVFEDYKSKK